MEIEATSSPLDTQSLGQTSFSYALNLGKYNCFLEMCELLTSVVLFLYMIFFFFFTRKVAIGIFPCKFYHLFSFRFFIFGCLGALAYNDSGYTILYGQEI